MSLAFEKARAYDPKTDPLFSAIEILETKEDIRSFLQGYIEHLKGEDLEPGQDPTQLALSNIQVAVGFYDEETRKRWEKAIPDIYYFCMGRRLDVVYDAPEDPNHPEDSVNLEDLRHKLGSQSKKKFI